MLSAARIMAGIAGLGVVGAVTHVNVAAAGGYGSASAPLIIAVAVVLVVGALCVGEAWSHGRHGLAIALALGLAAGEAWALLRTAERTLAHRDEIAAPRREAEAARQKALARIAEAERALATVGVTERLRDAQAAKLAADAAAQTKAAERGCAANCRLLLEQQTEAAGREVAEARTEIAALRTKAERDVAEARAIVEGLPAPRSANPLADTLGLQPWQIDLAEAVLASLALNGCGALLLAFAGHGHRPAVSYLDVSPAGKSIPAEPTAPEPRDASVEADRFARATFKPSHGQRVSLSELRQAYHDWCGVRGLEPLSDSQIGMALSSMFEKVGLYREGSGVDAAIIGIAWKDEPDATSMMTSTAA